MKTSHFLLFVFSAWAIAVSAARIGIMTDTHVGFEKGSAVRLERCFKLFKQQKVDMILHLGDIAEYHSPKFYQEYTAIRAKVYPEGCPPEKFVFSTHDRIKYVQKVKDLSYADAYADVQKLLGITHDRFHRFELEGCTFLIYPQARPYDRVREEIAAECTAHPGRPLFVLDHVPPMDTVNGSETGGKPVMHGIFKTHPEVIALSGHVHGSLAHEGKIWQGAYTAINFGAQKGDSVPGAPWMAAVMDLSPEKAVIHRFDTKTGREWRADDPWTLTFPFDPKTAPYRPEVRAAKVPPPAFVPDAAVTLARVGEPLEAVEVTFPAAVTKDIAAYLVSVQVRDGTNWVVRSEQLCRADYATVPEKRRKTFTNKLTSAHFDSGETVRIAVTPQDFYRRRGTALVKEFSVGEVERWQVATEAIPIPAKKGKWRNFKGGATFSVDGAKYFAQPPKTRCRLIMEAAIELPEDRFVRFSGLLNGGDDTAWQRFYSPRGQSVRRYVIPMTSARADTKTFSLVLDLIKRGRIRFDTFRIEYK